MEFKVIFYVLVGIGYFVYNNYKKLVSENKKRTFSPPAPVVVVEKPGRPQTGTERSKDYLLTRKPLLKKAVARKRGEAKYPAVVSLEENFSMELPEVFRINASEIPTIKRTVNRIPPDTFRNAVLYGELINTPAWTKY